MMQSGTKTAVYLGAVILAVIVGISVGLSSLEMEIQDPVTQDSAGGSDSSQVQTIDKSRLKSAPDLVGIADYINVSPEQLEEEIEGKVVLYDIWTYSCINCIRTLPYITAWDTKYADDGLLIIGIHSPEFEFEKNLDNVKTAVKKNGINYPVVLDNDKETWKAFENRYWPRKYIADHEGYIRYDHIGEGKYKETEKVIQDLLEERAQSLGMQIASAERLVDIEEFQHTSFRTPELYFGYYFKQGRDQLGNTEGFSPETIVEYSIPESVKQHYFYLDGQWENLRDGMKLISDSGTILLTYHAKEVNIVAGGSADLEIFLDGKPISDELAGKDVSGGKVAVNEHDLYNIVAEDVANTRQLQINVAEPGFDIFTFTFG